MKTIYTIITLLVTSFAPLHGQQSVAREWNEAMLNAIRVDEGRPTVHARNLFHISAVMYDAWAAYDDVANTFLLGNTIGGYSCGFDGIEIPDNEIARKAAQEEAISYAAYRLLKHRFKNSPGAAVAIPTFDALMIQLGYDTSIVTVDYTGGDPAALGNYIALSCMELGLIDYSDEEFNYDYNDAYYQAVNPALDPSLPGAPGIVDMNYWQPLSISGGNPTRFLNPQWGLVTPFSLTEIDRTVYDKNGNDYYLYHDPGQPPLIDTSGAFPGLTDYYKWNFALVAVWSGHLDPALPVKIDISPGSIGNLRGLPNSEAEMREFYKLLKGGVKDIGYQFNPSTGLPYFPQVVPLGDYGRVLAEFWADGPSSETPPGHWFTILNYVNDHPQFEKRLEGHGEILDDLEWDVKAYLTLGGAVHDVAIAVWGIKSYYDYIRPISAIRAMADLGQSSDSLQLSYHPGGIPLVEGHIAVVDSGDVLAGDQGENIGKIKIYGWKGPDYIGDPATSHAGVDWILAENWWPYQRPTFVTPPFAGYISGHSTFSRASAEVLTLLTGDAYFPGGMGVFDAPKDNYLIFENGPSVDIELQWATYRDASDQASLSRLWGGIHPPVDDIPGRQLGMKIGPQAFTRALELFSGETTAVRNNTAFNSDLTVMQNYPNPVTDFTVFEYSVRQASEININIYDMNGRLVQRLQEGSRDPGVYSRTWNRNDMPLTGGIYLYRLETNRGLSLPKKLMITGS